MLLSDAIILGCTISPHGKWDFKCTIDGSTCALGPALEALDKLSKLKTNRLDTGTENFTTVFDLWPWLETKGKNPVNNKVGTYSDIITTLNDVQGWTREQIAEWVSNVEPKQDEPDGGLAAGAVFEEKYAEVGA